MADSSRLQPYKGGYYLWKYVPSLPAAIIFALLFAGVTIAHCYRLWKTKLWRLCIWFAIGGLMEVIGFSARGAAHSATGTLMPYVLHNLFLLLPPVLFAVTIYMVLGHIIRSVNGEQYSLVRVDWLTRTFVLCDFFSFLVQSSAAGLMATGNNMELGERLVVAGLLIQMIAFGFFCMTAVVFHYRYQTRSVGAVAHLRGGRGGQIWKKLMYMYASSGLIVARSIFRVVEYALGHDGYSLTHEWTLYGCWLLWWCFMSGIRVCCSNSRQIAKESVRGRRRRN
ncbi:RTA1 like protein-domain-containing protein [Apodospora peruviana]|uniref:RTA1 like protein-domain-containing protein n=1 Tax=Apodospora peruviana TaxID=516989 RepID=A0AAE0IDF9_9PEZI|nr:RTA1 like protein-domain-containing protein [Apodospora peruviana]